jgi:hypothetical protein
MLAQLMYKVDCRIVLRGAIGLAGFLTHVLEVGCHIVLRGARRLDGFLTHVLEVGCRIVLWGTIGCFEELSQ